MLKAGKYEFPLGKKTYIMGILNYTPDSFSDGGEFFTPTKALNQAILMEKQGADIIDIGANSTRPGSTILSEEEELERLTVVIDTLKDKLSIPLSVDTFYPKCAEYALKNGVVIINDVSGTFNEEIALLVKKYNGAYIVTHNPASADDVIDYPDGVIAHIQDFFDESINIAQEIGLSTNQLCLDPGFGFGKSINDNYEIVNNFDKLKIENISLLAGASRKRMAQVSNNDTLEERDNASMLIHTLCIKCGADIIRVHNVPLAVKGASIADAICRKV